MESKITFLTDCLWAPFPTTDRQFPVGQAPGTSLTTAFSLVGVQAQATPTPGISFLIQKLSATPVSMTKMTIKYRVCEGAWCVGSSARWGLASGLTSHPHIYAPGT